MKKLTANTKYEIINEVEAIIYARPKGGDKLIAALPWGRGSGPMNKVTTRHNNRR